MSSNPILVNISVLVSLDEMDRFTPVERRALIDGKLRNARALMVSALRRRGFDIQANESEVRQMANRDNETPAGDETPTGGDEPKPADGGGEQKPTE